MWYGTFEILYRIRQKINYHKYRRVPQKNENRKKVVPDAIFFVKTMFSYRKNVVLGLTKYKKAQSRCWSHEMLIHKNKMTKTFSIFHLFHGKVESIFNLCGTNLEIQYHNVVIPQFYTQTYHTNSGHVGIFLGTGGGALKMNI